MDVCLDYHGMLCSECIKLTKVPSYLCQCHALFAESVNETCYVYVGAIIFSDPFWLMVSKGLLIYALGRFMPCHILLCIVPVAGCLLALNMPS